MPSILSKPVLTSFCRLEFIPNIDAHSSVTTIIVVSSKERYIYYGIAYLEGGTFRKTST